MREPTCTQFTRISLDARNSLVQWPSITRNRISYFRSRNRKLFCFLFPSKRFLLLFHPKTVEGVGLFSFNVFFMSLRARVIIWGKRARGSQFCSSGAQQFCHYSRSRGYFSLFQFYLIFHHFSPSLAVLLRHSLFQFNYIFHWFSLAVAFTVSVCPHCFCFSAFFTASVHLQGHPSELAKSMMIL